MMRIITGKARGVRLKTLEGEVTRPTSERVKEAVFSMLQFELEGREVLDLFAGSGQMGLEALSRGAKHAVFVDSSQDAIRIITENAEKTKLREFCCIRRSDSLDFLRRSQNPLFDIVFLDPPYASGLYGAALEALLTAQVLKPTSVIVCESDTDAIFGSHSRLYSAFTVKKVARYSKTVITLLTPTRKEEME